MQLSLKCLCVCVCAQMLWSAAANDYKVEILHGDDATLTGNSGHSGAFPQTSSFTHNGVAAWRALNAGGARVQNFPHHYLPGTSQITTPDNYLLKGGSKVKYYCAKGAGPCEVAVFVYECAPCKAKKGGLLQYLVLGGYARTRCAPTFTTGAVGGIQHRMSAYVKIIAEDTEEIITMPGDVEFVAFALSNGGKPECHTLADDKCEADTKGRCLWKGAEWPKCKLATCVNRGPGGGCDTATCVYAELKKEEQQHN